MKSNLDLVNECDVFPHPSKDPTAHASLLATLYTLLSNDIPIGYITEPVFNALAKVPIRLKGELEVNRRLRTISAFNQPTRAERSAAISATCAYWREHKTFSILEGWRDELYAVYGPENEVLFDIERSASPLFGVVTYGVHMTGFARVPDAKFGVKLWVPRRARDKSTYPGMLDNTVAGGLPSGELPLDAMVRECDEEASLPEELVRGNLKAVGTVTHVYIRDERAGGETGLVQPECEYVYDLEIPVGVECKPKDGEVEGFELMGVEEVQEALGRGEFKPNCALLVLDFFVRWGILNEGNEKDLKEIKERLHRELEFPGPHRGELAK
ncbi:thiamine pyrophosphokinase-related protein-like protein [Mollisia scopiformis]|uniref:Thiamin pyrophosphokinase-related protein-like protein n=1 Tax=Mollisia scopiformis TaxID=149040 RepID=A0A132B3C4_MOLSC|nr:thiamine pyrophosphokinase-related protein-like protein [Mollisia scopiformis]KUJ06896.1 thiamin pyrophosphokinase-related protein-like protein [Mollisia scopiformis]